jgi:hypothetical protein
MNLSGKRASHPSSFTMITTRTDNPANSCHEHTALRQPLYIPFDVPVYGLILLDTLMIPGLEWRFMADTGLVCTEYLCMYVCTTTGILGHWDMDTQTSCRRYIPEEARPGAISASRYAAPAVKNRLGVVGNRQRRWENISPPWLVRTQ